MEERLQRLRQSLRLEWGQLADRLGMSRAMLDFVRKGQRNLSFPALSRLEEVERSAGLAPPPQSIRETPPAYPSPEKNSSISIHADDIHELSRLVRELAARVERIEKQANREGS